MKWKNINISKNLIKKYTNNAILISMPHNSNYKGYVFWHTSKLTRTGRNSAAVSLGYTDDFIFTLKKYGNGKYNSREVIDEKVIDVEEFENAFGIIDENIAKKKIKNPYETHKPQKKEITTIKVIDELKDE